MYKILSWLCYYIGDFSYTILELFNNKFWVGFWYPIYHKFLCWSSHFQDKGGFDTDKVDDTTGWPWRKGSEDEHR